MRSEGRESAAARLRARRSVTDADGEEASSGLYHRRVRIVVFNQEGEELGGGHRGAENPKTGRLF